MNDTHRFTTLIAIIMATLILLSAKTFFIIKKIKMCDKSSVFLEKTCVSKIPSLVLTITRLGINVMRLYPVFISAIFAVFSVILSTDSRLLSSAIAA